MESGDAGRDEGSGPAEGRAHPSYEGPCVNKALKGESSVQMGSIPGAKHASGTPIPGSLENVAARRMSPMLRRYLATRTTADTVPTYTASSMARGPGYSSPDARVVIAPPPVLTARTAPLASCDVK